MEALDIEGQRTTAQARLSSTNTADPGLPAGLSVLLVAASFVGTAIEWYDFFLYGTAAALVFSRLFFPNVDPLVGTLSSFATFAVGFGARPLGGIVFGHFGDRLGAGNRC